MSPAKKQIQDTVVKEWLQEFRKETTQRSYLSALRKFKKELDITDLDEYVKNKPKVIADIRKFLMALEGRPSKTVGNYANAVRLFMQDQGIKISEEEWRKIRCRGFMPKRVKAETRDRKPSKVQLKQILNYADIKCRSMVLFLLSSGARIGETLQLKIEDFNLDADPPEATIRKEYTKGGVGGRIVYFSYEAHDAIRDWLRIKNETHRHRGDGTYKDERMFPWDSNTARFMWNTACDKAGLGIRDNNTGRRVYHLHSLRKFFRTKVGLDLDVTHALMGHAEYLDAAYLRLEQDREIAKVYLEAMPNVSVYEVEDQELREQASAIEQENLEMKSRMAKMELELTNLKRSLQKLVDLAEKR
jgi:integrase